MKTFGLVLALLFFLGLSISGAEEVEYVEQLLKNGQTLQVPVAKLESGRKRRAVGFLLNGNLKFLPVSGAEYTSITPGDTMLVVYDPRTGHIMWPEEVTITKLRQKRQQKSASLLVVAVCAGWLLWRIKPA
ncbi:hypothetical protein [Hymenobacter cellulosivorans]|uniref:DUF3592 domain-containing protein n=1 Tax=Hymenobacter cellulosivorans TaxID=2932249 RepID=A0ABY4F6T8_9BACT|nr:hypothetical protein [Hymenobacter cellulosivorans]UOQ52386.1 hypothetical protein MUN80_21870 [Hymenobacter cellulosivorans]